MLSSSEPKPAPRRVGPHYWTYIKVDAVITTEAKATQHQTLFCDIGVSKESHCVAQAGLQFRISGLTLPGGACTTETIYVIFPEANAAFL